MRLKALCQVLAAGVTAMLLPACFSSSQTRLPQSSIAPTMAQHPRAVATTARLPYAYASVAPYRDPKKPVEAAVKPPERIMPPVDPPPIVADKVAVGPQPELRAAPIVDTVTTAIAKAVESSNQITAAIADPPLVMALRCCYEKRASDALAALKSFDAQNQEALLTLLPITVRMSEGSLSQADPQEIAIIVDQLRTLVTSLQPLAEVRLEKMSFCKNIRKFGVYERMEGKPSFRSGDIVEIYGELRNLASERSAARPGEYRTRTNSTLEIREAAGNFGWRKEVPKAELTQTLQHDFYHHYRFQLPEMAPGPYVLTVEVVDVPTGRKARQKLEFRVLP